MNLHISKSKNSEFFYIEKSYVKENGSLRSNVVTKIRSSILLTLFFICMIFNSYNSIFSKPIAI